jgi:hypothetical protein
MGFTEIELWGGRGYRCSNCEQLYHSLMDVQKQECFMLIKVVAACDEWSDELMAWIVEPKGE